MTPSRPYVIVVGGFLGAGKTTAIRAAAMRLRERGCRVGVVTNDQASALIDSSTLREEHFEVREVAGGCFCCRLSDLVVALDQLLGASCDVILCEAVGSCTDIVATVILPLRRFYRDVLSVAPLTVVVDAERTGALLSGDSDLTYIIRQQLLEADVVLLNKVDRIAPSVVSPSINSIVPEAVIVPAIASEGIGVDEWLRAVELTSADPRPLMALDYDRYAAGEAALAWVDASFEVFGWHVPMELARAIADGVSRALDSASPTMHLKVRAENGTSAGQAHVTSGRQRSSASGAREPTESSRLTVNARVPGDPEGIRETVMESVRASCDALRVTMRLASASAFRPAYPKPQFRFGEDS